jgi:sugar-specific transcriptional regulator TrmB
MVEILLQQLGFTKKEIDIYLFLLKNGQASPSEISNKTKINRSTVYVIVQELLKKGIIKEDLASPTKTLVPLPPHELQNLYKVDEKELELKRRKIHTVISELEKIAKEVKYTIPTINFIPEEEIEEYLKKRTPAWDESIMQYDSTWWGFQDKTFLDNFQNWIDWYWNKADKKIKLKMLGNQSELEKNIKSKYKQREIRYYDKKHTFTSTIWINGDYVIIIHTKQSPMYLFEITDKDLANNLRQLFINIWNEG